VKQRRRIVSGEYSRSGYTVVLCSSSGESVVHTAGNHPRDSHAVGPDRLTLRQVRSYCIQTCREIAGEQHARYGGVTRIQEEET
jgi:hypothetical protein